MNWYSELLSTCIQDLLPLTGKMLSQTSFNNARVWTSCFHYNMHFVEYHWPSKLLSPQKLQFWNVPLAQDNTCFHSLTWFGKTKYWCQFQMCRYIRPWDCKGFLHHHWRLILAGWHKTLAFTHMNSRRHYNFQPHLAWGGDPMGFQLCHYVSWLRL